MIDALLRRASSLMSSYLVSWVHGNLFWIFGSPWNRTPGWLKNIVYIHVLIYNATLANSTCCWEELQNYNVMCFHVRSIDANCHGVLLYAWLISVVDELDLTTKKVAKTYNLPIPGYRIGVGRTGQYVSVVRWHIGMHCCVGRGPYLSNYRGQQTPFGVNDVSLLNILLQEVTFYYCVLCSWWKFILGYAEDAFVRIIPFFSKLINEVHLCCMKTLFTHLLQRFPSHAVSLCGLSTGGGGGGSTLSSAVWEL